MFLFICTFYTVTYISNITNILNRSCEFSLGSSSLFKHTVLDEPMNLVLTSDLVSH